MDIEDFGFIGFFTVIGLICLFVVFFIIHLAFITPIVAENAKHECFMQGSLSYVDFQERLFSTKAYGVRCEQPTTNSNINLNNQNPLISISGSTQ